MDPAAETICPRCQQPFTPRPHDQRYCSHRCSKAAERIQTRARGQHWHPTKPSLGPLLQCPNQLCRSDGRWRSRHILCRPCFHAVMASCKAKQRHVGQRAANRAMRSLGRANYLDPESRLCTYLCRICGAWHIAGRGTITPVKAEAIRTFARALNTGQRLKLVAEWHPTKPKS